VRRRLALAAMVALALLGGCDPADGLNSQPRMTDSAPPPGFTRVSVIVDTIDTQTSHRLDRAVTVLAEARVRNGSLATDVKTGLPLQHTDHVTTPDIVPYDMGPGVVQLHVEVSYLARAGERLHAYAAVNGIRQFQTDRTAQTPLEMGGTRRMIVVSFDVLIPN
jgi:hypothetical protein